jgi:hypothetical protein
MAVSDGTYKSAQYYSGVKGPARAPTRQYASFKPRSSSPAITFQNQSNSNLRSAGQNVNRVQGAASNLQGVGNDLVGQYNNTFAPINARLADTAEIPLSTFESEAATESANAFDRSRAMQQRDMIRMGINPNSGRFQGSMRDLGLLEAAARAGAITGAKNYGRNINFQRMMGVANFGQGVLGQGMGVLNNAGAMFGNAFGMDRALANDYGSIASSAAQLENTVFPTTRGEAINLSQAPTGPSPGINSQVATNAGQVVNQYSGYLD